MLDLHVLQQKAIQVQNRCRQIHEKGSCILDLGKWVFVSSCWMVVFFSFCLTIIQTPRLWGYTSPDFCCESVSLEALYEVVFQITAGRIYYASWTMNKCMMQWYGLSLQQWLKGYTCWQNETPSLWEGNGSRWGQLSWWMGWGHPFHTYIKG